MWHFSTNVVKLLGVQTNHILGVPMNKNDLIASVAAASDLTKADAGRAVDAVFASIESALKGGDEVRIVGFGTFSVAQRGFNACEYSVNSTASIGLGEIRRSSDRCDEIVLIHGDPQYMVCLNTTQLYYISEKMPHKKREP